MKALDDGGYEKGPRDPAAVPEPTGWLLLRMGQLPGLRRRTATGAVSPRIDDTEVIYDDDFWTYLENEFTMSAPQSYKESTV